MAVLKTFPMDLTVILGPKGLGVFLDSGATQPLVAVRWGEVSRGSSASFTVYLKNLGIEIINVGVGTVEDISAWGSLEGIPPSVTLLAGEIKQMVMKLSVLSGAAVNGKSATIQFLEV